MTTAGSGYTGYEAVRELRLELEELIDTQQRIVRELALETVSEQWDKELEVLADRVRSDSFKVLVLGQFNNGKSTFINALIGQQVLPSHATPTTAVINEVKYGKTPSVLLHPRLTDGQQPAEPFEVPVEELKDYVVVDRDDGRKRNPYVRAELFWPLELLGSGVELIDSPGLNEDPVRERQTVEYLGRADAVVMVLNAQQPATSTEVEFFTEVIRPLGHQDMFWVFNKINFVDEDEREELKDWARHVLTPYVEYAQRIFFVDAKGALKARLAGDAERLSESNLLDVEYHLEQFLARHRGLSKVLNPARHLQRSVRDVEDALAGRRELLNGTLQELRDGYSRNKAPLDRLRSRADLLVRNVEYQFNEIVRSADTTAEEFLRGLTSRIPELAAAVEISDPGQFVKPHKLKSTVEALQTELTQSTVGAMRRECATWANGDLLAEIRDSLDRIQKGIREDLREFEEELRAIRLDLALMDVEQPGASDELMSIDAQPAANSAAGALGAQFVGMQLLAGVLTGAVFGVGGALAVGTVASVVSAAGVLLVPVALPVAIIGAIAASYALGDRSALADVVRPHVTKRLAAQWAQEREPIRAQIVKATRAQLDQIKAQFSRELTGRVEVIQDQVDAALRDMTNGESEVAAQKQRLGALAAELDAIELALDQLVDRALEFERGSVADA